MDSMFKISTSDELRIMDDELPRLLTEVFVGGGFTSPVVATSLFDPTEVRKRGIIIGAREDHDLTLAGIIIVVPPHSAALKVAQDNEAELHLLAVLPQYRTQGLGGLLVTAAIEKSTELGCTKLILWTQVSMKSAQRLYEAQGFVYTKDMVKEGREFKVYERILDT